MSCNENRKLKRKFPCPQNATDVVCAAADDCRKNTYLIYTFCKRLKAFWLCKRINQSRLVLSFRLTVECLTQNQSISA